MRKLLAICVFTLVVLTGCDGTSDSASSTSPSPTGISAPAQTVDVQLQALGFTGGDIALNGEQTWTSGDLMVMTKPGPNAWRIFAWMSMPSAGEYTDIKCRMSAEWAQGPDFSASAMLHACNELLSRFRLDGAAGRGDGDIYWLEVQPGRAE